MADGDPLLVGDRSRHVMWWILAAVVSLGGLVLLTEGF
jgi:hypothetical protein